MDNIPTWIAAVVSISFGLLVAILVQIFVVPWQRKKILNQNKADKADFMIGDSDGETSSNGSPKRQKRPLSLVCDGKQLPAITESTELVSFPKQNGLIKKLSIDLSPTAIKPPNKYKIDPKIIEKAEHLLAHNKALDNTDLTITSLNYIDEYQGTLNGNNGRTNVRVALQSYFDRKNSHHGPKSPDAVSSDLK